MSRFVKFFDLNDGYTFYSVAPTKDSYLVRVIIEQLRYRDFWNKHHSFVDKNVNHRYDVDIKNIRINHSSETVEGRPITVVDFCSFFTTEGT